MRSLLSVASVVGWWRAGRVRREQAAIARARLAAVTGRGWVPPAGRELVDPGGDRATEVREEMANAPPTASSDSGSGESREPLRSASSAVGPDEEPAEPRRPGGWARSEWVARLRLDPGRRAAVAAVLAAVVAAAIAAVVTWRVRPVEEHVAVDPGPVVTSVSAAPSSGAEKIVVAVAGKVRRPGLVWLPPGSRVADAIDAAGGLQPGAQLGLLNLAQPLSDGQQVIVGLPGAAAPGGQAPGDTSGGAGGVPSAGAGGPVNLNTATIEQLETLPGVGPVTAQAIIDWREESGPFRSVDQLREVSGIGEVRFGQLADLVTV